MDNKKEIEKTAFILMPFKFTSDQDYEVYQSIFHEKIKPLLEEIGYKVFKEDDATQHTSINKESAIQLLKADLVIVDLDSLNPNNYYRLDVRYKMHGKPTVLLINEEKKDDIPLIDLSIYHQCSPINCVRGTNLAIRELIKHWKDVPVIIAF